MKKIIMTLFAAGALFITASAQNYKTGFGLFIDVGDGATAVGPHVKHFFTPEVSTQGMVLFSKGITAMGIDLSYNGNIPNAHGLSWNIGVGPQALIGKAKTLFAIRPSTGLEFTVPTIPVNVGFDWRPSLIFVDGVNFTAGRFGIAFKYILK